MARLDEPEHVQREVPQNALEQAAADGMAVIAQRLADFGPVRIVCVVQAENPPAGQLNAATTAHAVSGVGEVITMLLEHARECGVAIGMNIDVITG